jgi:fatty-acyl-CoA synthase
VTPSRFGEARVCRQELTPVSFIERAGTVFAGRIAVVDGDIVMTWREMRGRSRRMAGALRAAGVGDGERVAVLALNSEPLFLAHFGIPQAGAVICAVNARLNAREVAVIVEHAEATLLIHSAELKAQTADVPATIRRIELGSEFEDFLGTETDAPRGCTVAEDELVALDYTSGTTGDPKGVMYHHRGAYLNALAMVIESGLSVNERHLWTLPMFHCNGWSHVWAMAAAGGASICMPRIDPAEIWRALDTYAVTSFNAAPTVLTMLAEHAAAHRLQTPVRVSTGGAPPSPTLISRLIELNIEVRHLYGLTETFGPCAASVTPPKGANTPPATYLARQGFPHVLAGAIAVVDHQLTPVDANGQSVGEVVVRGNTVMRGYFKDPEATAAAFRGGWFHTGDLGVIHPDGSLELVDRLKDIIITGGENVSTVEVERVILTHPDVLEVAVISSPNPKWGEVPKAFVSLKSGRSPSEADIVDHVRHRLAHFKAPRTVVFSELPKTSTGKIQKHLLREREWADQPRRVK